MKRFGGTIGESNESDSSESSASVDGEFSLPFSVVVAVALLGGVGFVYFSMRSSQRFRDTKHRLIGGISIEATGIESRPLTVGCGVFSTSSLTTDDNGCCGGCGGGVGDVDGGGDVDGAEGGSAEGGSGDVDGPGDFDGADGPGDVDGSGDFDGADGLGDVDGAVGGGDDDGDGTGSCAGEAVDDLVDLTDLLRLRPIFTSLLFSVTALSATISRLRDIFLCCSGTSSSTPIFSTISHCDCDAFNLCSFICSSNSVERTNSMSHSLQQ